MLHTCVVFDAYIGNEEKISMASCLIKDTSFELYDEQNFYYIHLLSKILREILNSKFKGSITDEIVKSFVNMLKDTKNILFIDKQYEAHQKICEEIIKYQKFGFVKIENIRDLQLEIGKAYELESNYQQGSEKKSVLVKGSFLEQAMEHYKNIGESQKVDDMKVLIKQTYEEFEKSDEWKTISSEIKIPCEVIQKQIDFFVESSIQESLDKIIYTTIIPDEEQVTKEVNQLAGEFPLQAMLSRAKLSKGKKVDESTTKEESLEMDINKQYMLHVDLEIGMVLEKVYHKLINEQNFSAKDIMDRFTKWGLLDENNFSIIEIGMNRFFEEDYVSAMHILVPQLESTVRNLFAKAGFSTTSIKKKTTQHEQTFNNFLENKYVEEELNKLDKNLHKLFQVVLVSQSGLNLRNDIAHGLIDFHTITKSRCIIVIYLFLILTRCTINTKNS